MRVERTAIIEQVLGGGQSLRGSQGLVAGDRLARCLAAKRAAKLIPGPRVARPPGRVPVPLACH